jgi:hypothetical protein
MTALLFAISATAAVMRAVAVLSSGVVVNGSPTRPVESSRSLHVRPKSEQLGKRHGVGITSYYILCSGARLRSNRRVGAWVVAPRCRRDDGFATIINMNRLGELTAELGFIPADAAAIGGSPYGRRLVLSRIAACRLGIRMPRDDPEAEELALI